MVQTRFAEILFVFAVCEIKFDLICFNFFLTYLAMLNFSKIIDFAANNSPYFGIPNIFVLLILNVTIF